MLEAENQWVFTSKFVFLCISCVDNYMWTLTVSVIKENYNPLIQRNLIFEL